ncbi:MAG: chorismate mutase [Candidatus Pacearchaeota archaeon]|nr:chorismate mutase [Candidatus Pacearchaeota archaeon]
MVDEKINEMHAKLDEIDLEILDLLEKRMEMSKKLGNYKKSRGFFLGTKLRSEEAMQARIGKSDLNPKFVRELFEVIFKESERVQKE